MNNGCNRAKLQKQQSVAFCVNWQYLVNKKGAKCQFDIVPRFITGTSYWNLKRRIEHLLSAIQTPLCLFNKKVRNVS
jgi:hypothetical protein